MAHKLTTLIDYQEGSVVSRVIMKKKTGSITLFAFDRGEGLSEHTTPFDAFVSILEGDALIMIDGEQFHLTGGDGIILPADKPHAVSAEDRFKMILTMIRSE